MSYKYTRDNDRKIFTQNGSKYADDFISFLREMNWDWRYEGENTFLIATYDESTDKSDFAFVKLPCVATPPPIPYFVFGGYVYELLNKEFGGLQKFLDPTGDVDVRLNTPAVTLTEKDKYVSVYNFWYEQAECTKLNEIMESYSTHLFSLVLSKMTEMRIENTVDFDITEDDEYNDEAIVVRVGNVYLVRVCNPSSVKIQIVCKFSNMSSPDHLFEMVWLIKNEKIDESLEQLKHYKEINPKIQGVFVQDLKSLIVDNVGSANDRMSLYGTVKQHKWFNHIQRLKYLNAIFKEVIRSYADNERSVIGTLLCYMFLFLLKTEGVHVFSLGDRVAKTNVIFNQLTSNFLEFVIEMKGRINNQIAIIFRGGQRVTFSHEMIDKYFKDRKIDILIADIQAKYRDTTIPGLLKPRIMAFKSERGVPLKTRNNSKLGLTKKIRSLRRTLSMSNVNP